MDTLATSFAPGWERMNYAMMQFMALLPSHFPDADLFERDEKLFDEATAYGPWELNGRQYRGALENTLRRRKRRTLERYAAEILSIYTEVQNRRGHYTE